MKQNITLSVEKDIILKGKVIAARKQSSISKMMSEYLNELVDNEDRYEAAKRSALRTIKKGFHLGGHRNWKREDLYER